MTLIGRKNLLYTRYKTLYKAVGLLSWYKEYILTFALACDLPLPLCESWIILRES
jgi:hypothetical protein